MSLDIRDARVIYKNFSGAKTDMNRNGTRTVDIIIEDPEIAKMMEEDGWNVKHTKIREEGDVSEDYINVVVNFNTPSGKPPEIFMRTIELSQKEQSMYERFIKNRQYAEAMDIVNNGTLKSRAPLNENTIGGLDKQKILSVDARINPHEWEMNGRSGIKGYVNYMTANVLYDAFAMRYADEEYPTDDEELPFN